MRRRRLAAIAILVCALVTASVTVATARPPGPPAPPKGGLSRLTGSLAGARAPLAAHTSIGGRSLPGTRSAATALAATAVSGPIYSGLAGKCMDDAGNSAADGATVDLYDCTGTPGQNWRLMDDGTMQINGK